MIMDYLNIPHSAWVRHSKSYESIIWSDQPRCSKEEWENAKTELAAAEPMRLLRQQRNQLLAQSDWMAVSDRVMTQAQIDYRQALRDLPANSTPALDENGQLTGVNWPTPPTD